jgi:hypothetical protein
MFDPHQRLEDSPCWKMEKELEIEISGDLLRGFFKSAVELGFFGSGCW